MQITNLEIMNITSIKKFIKKKEIQFEYIKQKASIYYYRFYYAIFAAIKIILIDQVTKWWFMAKVAEQPNYIIKVTSFFNIVYSWNFGVSFGMLATRSVNNYYFLITLTILLCIYLLYLIFTAFSLRVFYAYSIIFGGAIGNLIDRINYGAVYDFLDFHYNNLHFPAFNIADCAIFIGFVIASHEHYLLYKMQNETNNNPCQD